MGNREWGQKKALTPNPLPGSGSSPIPHSLFPIPRT
jgi:hypothetical protein